MDPKKTDKLEALDAANLSFAIERQKRCAAEHALATSQVQRQSETLAAKYGLGAGESVAPSGAITRVDAPEPEPPDAEEGAKPKPKPRRKTAKK